MDELLLKSLDDLHNNFLYESYVFVSDELVSLDSLLPLVGVAELTLFEMQDDKHKLESITQVAKLVSDLMDGATFPPLAVERTRFGFKFLDGMHRLLAYRDFGLDNVRIAIFRRNDSDDG